MHGCGSCLASDVWGSSRGEARTGFDALSSLSLRAYDDAHVDSTLSLLSLEDSKDSNSCKIFDVRYIDEDDIDSSNRKSSRKDSTSSNLISQIETGSDVGNIEENVSPGRIRKIQNLFRQLYNYNKRE